MNEIDSLYTDLIMEHSMNSEYKHHIHQANHSQKGHNPSCGDEITLELNIVDGVLEDMGFVGHGCAISQSSTSIMIETLLGKSIPEALEITQRFMDMIKREITDEEELEILEDAIAFQNISNMPSRVKCAVLAWHTLNDILLEETK